MIILRVVTLLSMLLVSITNTRAQERVKVGIYQDSSIDMFFFESDAVKKIRGRDYKFYLRSFTISENEGEIIYIDMVEDNVEFCKKENEWLCVIGNMYSFAIPLNLSKNEWHREGTKYLLLGETSLEFMGKKIEVFVIYSETQLPEETTESEKFPSMMLKRVHFFSEKYGLIAFGRICPESHETSIVYSRYRCGYGGLIKYCEKSEQRRRLNRKANIDRNRKSKNR